MTDQSLEPTLSKASSQSVSTKRNDQSSVGRPTVITDEVIAKLVQCFEDGSTITEACRTAQIDQSTYFRRVDSDEEFRKKMSHAQEYPDAVAKMEVVRAIKGGDVDTSKWWLENHVRDEFYKRKNTDLTSKGEKVFSGADYIGEHNDKANS